ncbi:hypothetical protein ONZ45_g8740 [Pleurotus djamor]|nr:hypothetical protein ONZ45_g8740 [Pleurotus djamor]
MPSLDVVALEPHRIRRADDPSASEEASLHGQKAKTPIIAGSICGGVMGLAWIIGFTIYFMKRNRRKKRKAAIAAGLIPPPEPKPSEKEFEDGIIIPPDPAVLLGQRQPGERVYVNGKLMRSTSRPTPNQNGTHSPPHDEAPPRASLSIPRRPPSSSDSPPQTPLTARISEEMLVPPHV